MFHTWLWGRKIRLHVFLHRVSVFYWFVVVFLSLCWILKTWSIANSILGPLCAVVQSHLGFLLMLLVRAKIEFWSRAVLSHLHSETGNVEFGGFFHYWTVRKSIFHVLQVFALQVFALCSSLFLTAAHEATETDTWNTSSTMCSFRTCEHREEKRSSWWHFCALCFVQTQQQIAVQGQQVAQAAEGQTIVYQPVNADGTILQQGRRAGSSQGASWRGFLIYWSVCVLCRNLFWGSFLRKGKSPGRIKPLNFAIPPQEYVVTHSEVKNAKPKNSDVI